MIHAHPNEATSLLTSANIIHTNGGGPSVQQHVPSSNSSRLLHSNDIFPSFSFSRISSDYWERYLAAVETHPLVTKSVTASIILGSADLTAQFVEKLQQQGGLEPDAIAESVVVDWLRTLRFAAIGLIGAPWSHFYFYWLDRSLPPSVDPWTTTTAVKVIIDQFVQAPILLAILISSLSFMKRFHWSDVNRDVHDNFIFTLIANCTCPGINNNAFNIGHRNDIFSTTLSSISKIYSILVFREALDTSVDCQHCICSPFVAGSLRKYCFLLLDNHS